MRKFFASLIFLILFSSIIHAEEYIDTYHVDITILDNGNISVTENIKVWVEGKDIKRGIYRWFSLWNTEKYQLPMPYNITDVTRNGKTETIGKKIIKASDRAEYYFGDPNKFIEPIIIGGSASDGISRNKNPITDGTAITRPKPDAVAMARCIGTLYNVIIGTPNEPPPIPIKTEPNPRIIAINIFIKPLGISLEIRHSALPTAKYKPTQTPKTPNIIIKKIELNLAAKISPNIAPKLKLKLHSFNIDQSTAPFL